jgi:myo-inositol-1(or 4)-monophosphatase
MNIENVSRIGLAAAYRAAGVLRAHYGNLSGVRKKGETDLVTDADIASERVIVETIRSRYPDHAVLAEESGLENGEAPCKWIIDPLDGTTNFSHGVGLFAVSIAFSLEGVLSFGLVLNPITGDLFTARIGEGAQHNRRPIRVTRTEAVSESLLVTGFSYDFKDIFPEVMHRLGACLKASRGVRRLGSAALDLCMVANGNFEAFWEQHLKSWDTAAGTLIVREAGGVVTDFKDRPYSVDDPEILATNGGIHQEMIQLLELENE